MNEEKRKEREPESGKEEQKAAKTEGGNKPLFFGIIGGVLVLNIVLAVFLARMMMPRPQDENDAKSRADSLRIATETATSMGATTADAIEAIVNIAGTDGERFLKAAILFEYDGKAYPALAEELSRRGPKFKNLLIDHLSKLTLIEVTEPEAKEKIRKDLLRLVNNSLPPKLGEVREVLFSTYIIQ